MVGAYAVSFHSRPRGTGDLDVWVEPSPENAARVMRALKAFGAPLSDLKEADLLRPDTVFQIGVPPRRIDLLTTLTGVQFGEAWASRVRGRLGQLECDFIGKEVLIKNKRALGRPRDLADLGMLAEQD